MIGARIDEKYEITAPLGEGAMGEVYAARHLATGRTVAVKLIRASAGADASVIARFHREARAAGAIESIHIAQVLDAGRDDALDAPYLVMELLRGEDLKAVIVRLGALPHDLALRIVAHALNGLERAHAAGVIHRDLKPANLFLAAGEGDGRIVKIVDFGIAKMHEEVAATSHALTQTGRVLGSPLYMSPEQAKSSKHIDGRSDLWSLGVVLFELMTGITPHGEHEALTSLLLAICTKDPPPIRDVAPWLPLEVGAIVDRALQRDKTRRFSSAAEMRAAISAVVPDGNRLTESMFEPLSEALRASLRPQMVLSAFDDTVEDSSSRGAPAGAGSIAGSVVTPPRAAPKRSRTAMFAVGGGLLVVSSVAVFAGGRLYANAKAARVVSAPLTTPSAAPEPAPLTSVAKVASSLPGNAEPPSSSAVAVPARPTKVRPPGNRVVPSSPSPAAQPAKPDPTSIKRDFE